MHRRRRLTSSLLLAAIVTCLLTACGGDYQQGYKEGYRIGHQEGEASGYRQGLIEGYASGSVAFTEKHSLPSLAMVILIVAASVLLYWVYRYLRTPAKHLIDKQMERVDLSRQRCKTRKQLERQQQLIPERARIAALIHAEKIFSDRLDRMADCQKRVVLERHIDQIVVELSHIDMGKCAGLQKAKQVRAAAIDQACHLSLTERSDAFRQLQSQAKKGDLHEQDRSSSTNA